MCGWRPGRDGTEFQRGRFAARFGPSEPGTKAEPAGLKQGGAFCDNRGLSPNERTALTRAMILAAGRGERMKPLTDHTPKPLLAVGGKPLIVWHIEALARAGVRELVINHAWLGDKLEAALGDGSRFGVSIAWSREGEALETAGGIATALPLLGDAPFIVLNGDVFADYPVASLLAAARDLEASRREAHLVLVPYPQHKAGARLGLDTDSRVRFGIETEALTYSGLGAYHPAFFADCRAHEKRPLLPIFEASAQRGLLSGEIHRGAWTDVGTPERLAELDAQLREAKPVIQTDSEIRA